MQVRKLMLFDGRVSTLAGDGTAAVLDGLGVAAQFNLQTAVRAPLSRPHTPHTPSSLVPLWSSGANARLEDRAQQTVR